MLFGIPANKYTMRSFTVSAPSLYSAFLLMLQNVNLDMGNGKRDLVEGFKKMFYEIY
jgi:hypothetical protein